MFLLSMYADRQWKAEMLYGNTVKIFIPDGDVTIWNEHGTIYAISSDFGDRMITQHLD